MQPDELRSLYDYNYWASARVLDIAGELDPEIFVAPAPLSHGSLRGTLVHILSTEWVWRLRCQSGTSVRALLPEADFPTVAALRARWDGEEQAMRGFLAGLSADDLARDVRYTNTRGAPFATPLWQILVHVVNHGTQFRSEAAVRLTQLGHSPGDLDYIAFLRSLAP